MTTTGRGMGATLTRARVGGHPTSSRSWSPSHRCGVGAELAAAVAENTAPGTATLRQSTPMRIHRLMVVPPFTRKAGHPVVLGVSRPIPPGGSPSSTRRSARRVPHCAEHRWWSRKHSSQSRGVLQRVTPRPTRFTMCFTPRGSAVPTRYKSSSRAGASTAPGVPQRGRQPILRNRGRTRRARP